MTLADRLRKKAETIAESLGKEITEAEQEKRRLADENKNKGRLLFLEKEIRLAEVARNRLRDYRPRLKPGHHMCPYCWIMDGKSVVLPPLHGSVRSISCWSCANDFQLEI